MADENSLNLPILGNIKIEHDGTLGLSIFISLIDGFNPCAMWVLLILLSLLIHMRDRKKMALISITFVIVGGVVYFTFMNTWLLLYDFVGIGRKMQLFVGIVAFIIGAIHIKDFIWFKKGLHKTILLGEDKNLF